MKTALEWTDEMGLFDSNHIRTIEKIQLDAWKQGMNDAREICLNHKNNACDVGFASQFDCAESIKKRTEEIDSWGLFI